MITERYPADNIQDSAVVANEAFQLCPRYFVEMSDEAGWKASGESGSPAPLNSKITEVPLRVAREAPVGEHHNGSFNIYFSHKISKLQDAANLVQPEDVVSDIFKGCYVFINGATNPPIEELRRLITRYGGTVDQYQVPRITHFLCNSFTDAQLKRIREKVKVRERQIYVTERWVLESIRSGKRLHEANFVPEGLRGRHGGNITSHILANKSSKMPSAAVLEPKLLVSSACQSSSSSSTSGDGGKPHNYPVLQSSSSMGSASNSTSIATHKDSLSISVNQYQDNMKNNISSCSNSSSSSSSSSSASRGAISIASADREPGLFLKQYFTQSRLHFNGSWRNRLPSMVKKLSSLLSSTSSSSTDHHHHHHLPVAGAGKSNSSISGLSSTYVEVGGVSCASTALLGTDSSSLGYLRNMGERRRSFGGDRNDPSDSGDSGEDDDQHLLYGIRSIVSHPTDTFQRRGVVLQSDEFKPALCACLREAVKSSSATHRADATATTMTTRPQAQDYHSRIFVHVDMDCFFVSALLKDESRAHLRSQPVAVAHSADSASSLTATASTLSSSPELNFSSSLTTAKISSSSEISSCNYPARAKGVKNGMYLGEARKRCPELRVLSYDFPLYEAVSEKVYEILYSSGASKVEPVSVDEAYLEFAIDQLPSLSSSSSSAGSVCGPCIHAVVTALRERIKRETGAGIGSNMLQARLATKKAKPDGQFSLGIGIQICPSSSTYSERGTSSTTGSNPPRRGGEEDIMGYMKDLPIRELPGVGYQMGKKLKEKELETCGDLWKLREEQLKEWFGAANGHMLWNACRGVDETELQTLPVRKSIGVEVNWGIRFSSISNAEAFMQQLCREIASRIAQAGCGGGRTLTVKLLTRMEGAPKDPPKFLGCGKCDAKSRSISLNVCISDSDAIAHHAIPIFRDLIKNIDPTDIRGVGLHLTRLAEGSSISISSSSILSTSTSGSKSLSYGSTSSNIGNTTVTGTGTESAGGSGTTSTCSSGSIQHAFIRAVAASASNSSGNLNSNSCSPEKVPSAQAAPSRAATPATKRFGEPPPVSGGIGIALKHRQHDQLDNFTIPGQTPTKHVSTLASSLSSPPSRTAAASGTIETYSRLSTDMPPPSRRTTSTPATKVPSTGIQGTVSSSSPSGSVAATSSIDGESFPQLCFSSSSSMSPPTSYSSSSAASSHPPPPRQTIPAHNHVNADDSNEADGGLFEHRLEPQESDPLFVPSLSQLDLDVVSSLPEELRVSVLKQLEILNAPHSESFREHSASSSSVSSAAVVRQDSSSSSCSISINAVQPQVQSRDNIHARDLASSWSTTSYRYSNSSTPSCGSDATLGSSSRFDPVPSASTSYDIGTTVTGSTDKGINDHPHPSSDNATGNGTSFSQKKRPRPIRPINRPTPIPRSLTSPSDPIDTYQAMGIDPQQLKASVVVEEQPPNDHGKSPAGRSIQGRGGRRHDQDDDLSIRDAGYRIDEEPSPMIFSSTQDYQQEFLASMPSPLRREVQAQFELANDLKLQQRQQHSSKRSKGQDARGGADTAVRQQHQDVMLEDDHLDDAINKRKRPPIVESATSQLLVAKKKGPFKHTATEVRKHHAAVHVAAPRGHRLGKQIDITTGFCLQSVAPETRGSLSASVLVDHFRAQGQGKEKEKRGGGVKELNSITSVAGDNGGRHAQHYPQGQGHGYQGQGHGNQGQGHQGQGQLDVDEEWEQWEDSDLVDVIGDIIIPLQGQQQERHNAAAAGQAAVVGVQDRGESARKRKRRVSFSEEEGYKRSRDDGSLSAAADAGSCDEDDVVFVFDDKDDDRRSLHLQARQESNNQQEEEEGLGLLSTVTNDLVLPGAVEMSGDQDYEQEQGDGYGYYDYENGTYASSSSFPYEEDHHNVDNYNIDRSRVGLPREESMIGNRQYVCTDLSGASLPPPQSCSDGTASTGTEISAPSAHKFGIVPYLNNSNKSVDGIAAAAAEIGAVISRSMIYEDDFDNDSLILYDTHTGSKNRVSIGARYSNDITAAGVGTKGNAAVQLIRTTSSWISTWSSGTSTTTNTISSSGNSSGGGVSCIASSSSNTSSSSSSIGGIVPPSQQQCVALCEFGIWLVETEQLDMAAIYLRTVHRCVDRIINSADDLDPLAFTQTSDEDGDDDSLQRVREKRYAAAQEWRAARDRVEASVQKRSKEIFAASIAW